ncbi:Uncharacterised protein [Segatella copri]|nr:Uncharacterised protein [Segatella copri]
MHCRIDGSEVNTLQKIFLKMWNKVSGQNVHSTEFWRYKKKDYLVENLKPDTTATAYRKMVGIINREPLPPYQDYHGRRQVLYRWQCQSQCPKPALGL